MFWYWYNHLAGLSGSILGSCQAAKRCNKNLKEMWCCSALVTLMLFSCPAWLRHDTSRSCPALLCRAEHFFLSGSCLANVWLRERYSGQSQAGFRLWSVQKFRTGNSHFSIRYEKLARKREPVWDWSFQPGGMRVGKYINTTWHFSYRLINWMFTWTREKWMMSGIVQQNMVYAPYLALCPMLSWCLSPAMTTFWPVSFSCPIIFSWKDFQNKWNVGNSFSYMYGENHFFYDYILGTSIYPHLQTTA